MKYKHITIAINDNKEFLLVSKKKLKLVLLYQFQLKNFGMNLLETE